MDVSTDIPWQPLTPRGVAAFAHASLRRLFILHLIVALMAAMTAIWFLHQAWIPIIEGAINQLPPKGEIRSGRLDWRGDSPVALAENTFLAIAVDLQHTGGARSAAQVQLEFGQAKVQILSLFGFFQTGYPTGWRVAFNRAELQPWWGAWSPSILVVTAGSFLLTLLLAWLVLMTVYALPVWLMALFAGRSLSLTGSWRLAGAALMPGAVLLITALLGYSFGFLDLVRLLVAAGVHLLIGWVYLIAGVLALPRHLAAAPTQPNPFK